MEQKDEQLNAEALRKKALKQLMSGESLYGRNGAFAPMLKSFLEAALEGELDSHLDEAVHPKSELADYTLQHWYGSFRQIYALFDPC